MKRLHSPVYKSRMKGLGKVIIPHLQENFKVLDVGCGFGEFSNFIINNEETKKGVNIIGVEKLVRPNSLIKVEQMVTNKLPFDNNSFDCVMLLDVLHHEQDWSNLLNECIRVSKNLVIIKDHQVTSKLSYYRICFLDWLANKPYGILCLYRYFKADQWRKIFESKNMKIIQEELTLKIYPPILPTDLSGQTSIFSGN